jgi:hypothetical protein
LQQDPSAFPLSASLADFLLLLYFFFFFFLLVPGKVEQLYYIKCGGQPTVVRRWVDAVNEG